MAEALRVLLALTVPHMAVVLWLDRSPDVERESVPSGVRPPNC